MKMHTLFWRLVFILGLIMLFTGFYFWAKSGFAITFNEATGVGRKDQANVEIEGLWLILTGTAIVANAFFELLFKK